MTPFSPEVPKGSEVPSQPEEKPTTTPEITPEVVVDEKNEFKVGGSAGASIEYSGSNAPEPTPEEVGETTPTPEAPVKEAASEVPGEEKKTFLDTLKGWFVKKPKEENKEGE